MFWAVLILFSGWVLSVVMNKGPREGLWYGWLVSMLLLPVWLVKPMGSITLDLRTVGAMLGLAGFLLNPSEKLRYKFAVMDLFVFGLFMTQLLSGFGAGEVSMGTIPELMRRWLLPYIVGRMFVSTPKDFSRFLPVVAKILMVLSVLAVIEAVTKMNLPCKIFGKSFPLLDAGEGFRWGIKRAHGALEHPIFYGMMLVMCFPFAVEAGRKALLKDAPRWCIALPFALFVAVFCTASRGPIIASMATVYLTVTFSLPKLRVLLIVAAIVGGGGIVTLKDHIKEMISKSVETDDGEKRYVWIGGHEYRYTGTAHRELLFLVYAKAMREAPLFGFGARLRGVPIDEELALRFSSIDNHYLLFFLQRGAAGLTMFLAITALGLIYLILMAWNTKLSYSVMAGSMSGALLGVSALLMSVWFAPDHGSVWLFFVGLAACMWTLDPRDCDEQSDSDEKADEQVESISPILKRRLVRGFGPATQHELD